MRFINRHILIAYCFSFLALPAWGASSIILTQVNAPVKENQLYLDATADIRLPAGVQMALDNGIDIFLDATIQILSQRPLFPDKKIAVLNIRRRIAFHALTDKYTVDDLTLGTRKSFSSLLSALIYAGKYRDVSLLDIALAKPFDKALMRMRIKMSRRELPIVLRLKSYLARDWYVSSDWYVWPLQ